MHRNIDFVKKIRQNLSLAVLIALVLIKEKACISFTCHGCLDIIIITLHGRRYRVGRVDGRPPTFFSLTYGAPSHPTEGPPSDT